MSSTQLTFDVVNRQQRAFVAVVEPRFGQRLEEAVGPLVHDDVAGGHHAAVAHAVVVVDAALVDEAVLQRLLAGHSEPLRVCVRDRGVKCVANSFTKPVEAHQL